MSYCELVPFKNGLPCSGPEFGNAWGGSARIWTALFDKYIPKKNPYDSWIQNVNERRLWDLAKNTNLPIFERSVHAFTFDKFYVKQENLKRFIGDLKLFVENNPVKGGQVDHLPSWIEWIRINPDVEALGLYGTSVSENLWFRQKGCPHCGHSIDETECVPLNEGFEVYDWLEELAKENECQVGHLNN